MAHTYRVATDGPWWIWFLPMLFSAPWIAGILWFWPRGARSNDAPLSSMAEMARQRWSPR